MVVLYSAVIFNYYNLYDILQAVIVKDMIWSEKW